MTLNIRAQTKLVTFDTYGTLIDWNSSLIAYLAPILTEKGSPDTAEEFYHFWYYKFALIAVTEDPYVPYRQLLQETLKGALSAKGLAVHPNDGADFGDAMAESRPFPEVNRIMAELHRHYKLATISNSQHDILKRSADLLNNPFDAMFTAEDTRAYKPDQRLFDLVQEHFGVTSDEIVHVAQSQYVDLPRSVPMGIPTVWINRQGQQLDAGIPAPDVILPDMNGLPSLIAEANKK